MMTRHLPDGSDYRLLSDGMTGLRRSTLLRAWTLVWSATRETVDALNDALLALTSYPEPTSAAVFEDAVSFSASFGA